MKNGVFIRVSATRLLAVAASLILLPAGIAPGLAQSLTHRADYKVSILGIPMASINFTTRIDGSSYKISGDLQTSFLAEVIEPNARNHCVLRADFG